MNSQEFKIWMIQNSYNQKTLAKVLGLTETTISSYVVNNKFPIWFKYALRGLEL